MQGVFIKYEENYGKMFAGTIMTVPVKYLFIFDKFNPSFITYIIKIKFKKSILFYVYIVYNYIANVIRI